MALLNDGQVEAALLDLEGWSRSGDEIVKEYEFEDFVGSVAFVDQLVAPAERLGHHPDVLISWNRVEIKITTHSEGGLTAADFELAGEIEKLV